MRERRKGLKRSLFWLYEGSGRWPFLFRWALLIFDLLSIAFFLWEPFHSWRKTLHSDWYVKLDIIIAIYITMDFFARMYIAESRAKFFRRIHNIADVFVVLTLIAPVFFENLVFLRVLRIIRIVRAFTFLRRLESVSGYLNRHRVVIDRITNFVVFIFIMSALVYVNQVGQEGSQIHTQLDALYFTVTSLTTTGYGDILMQGQGGKLLAIVIMILGLTLFVRMLQSIVSAEDKLRVTCKTCGLSQHDPDAVHCKRCGAIIVLPQESFSETAAESEKIEKPATES